MKRQLTGIWNIGIDVGVSELISSGKVIVKQGVELEKLTPDSLVFNDGSALEVDVIVWAYVSPSFSTIIIFLTRRFGFIRTGYVSASASVRT
jgi:hypothetical protein